MAPSNGELLATLNRIPKEQLEAAVTELWNVIADPMYINHISAQLAKANESQKRGEPVNMSTLALSALYALLNHLLHRVPMTFDRRGAAALLRAAHAANN